MRNLDPHDVPDDGSRQDMTLAKVGYLDVSTEEPKICIVGVIDNGDYTRKRVSHVFEVSTEDGLRDWKHFQKAIGVSHGPSTDKASYLQPLVDACKDERFSAVVHVEFFESKKNGKGARYSLSGFDKALEPPTLKFDKSRFIREAA